MRHPPKPQRRFTHARLVRDLTPRLQRRDQRGPVVQRLVQLPERRVFGPAQLGWVCVGGEEVGRFGEETGRERRVGDEADAEGAEERQEGGFGVPAYGVVVPLVDGGEDVVSGRAVGVDFLDLGGEEVGDSELSEVSE